jgi:hypothetical protein
VSDEIKGSGQFSFTGPGAFRGAMFVLLGAGIVGAIWLFSGSDTNKKFKVSVEYEQSAPEKFKQPSHEKPLEVIPSPRAQEPVPPMQSENKPKLPRPQRYNVPYYYEYPRGLGYFDLRQKRLCPPGFDTPEVCYMPRENRLNTPVYPSR